MNQEKQLLEQALSELQARRENTDREDYGPLIEDAEALIQKYGAGGAGTKIGDETLAALYFLTAELLFEKDLATRKATRGKSFENEAKALEYYNKAVALQDKEEYSYELWNFLSSAGHKEEGIAALERFIERTGGTAKVLSRAAEYILMYADSEDTGAIQKSLDYFYRAVEMEPDRYETYWAYWTDLEEAVDVCPRLMKEAFFCLEELIRLSLPENAENHDTLGNRYFELAGLYNKQQEYEKALEVGKKGLAAGGADWGYDILIELLVGMNRFEEAVPYCHNRIESLIGRPGTEPSLARVFFRLAHCYHMINQPAQAEKFYLAFENGQDIVPSEYRDEYLLYYKNSRKLWERIKRWFRRWFRRG